MTETMWDLLRECWREDRTRRPNISEIPRRLLGRERSPTPPLGWPYLGSVLPVTAVPFSLKTHLGQLFHVSEVACARRPNSQPGDRRN